MLQALRRWAKSLKQKTLLVYLAAKDPRTPRWVRAVAALTVAYALSPIDLIPDFIPVLGYLDDVILVPLGLALVLRHIPADVYHDAQRQAQTLAQKPVSYAAGAVILGLWLSGAAALGLSLYHQWGGAALLH